MKDKRAPTEVELLIVAHGYWGNHPLYPVETWMYEVANGNTRRSYWEWVAACGDDDEGRKA